MAGEPDQTESPEGHRGPQWEQPRAYGRLSVAPGLQLRSLHSLLPEQATLLHPSTLPRTSAQDSKEAHRGSHEHDSWLPVLPSP